jgi:hypothetical protein
MDSGGQGAGGMRLARLRRRNTTSVAHLAGDRPRRKWPGDHGCKCSLGGRPDLPAASCSWPRPGWRSCCRRRRLESGGIDDSPFWGRRSRGPAKEESMTRFGSLTLCHLGHWPSGLRQQRHSRHRKGTGGTPGTSTSIKDLALAPARQSRVGLGRRCRAQQQGRECAADDRSHGEG